MPGQNVVVSSVPFASPIEAIGIVSELRLSESDQADPAGRFRIQVSGDILLFQRAATAGWATATTYFAINGTTGNVGLGGAADATTRAYININNSFTVTGDQPAHLLIQGTITQASGGGGDTTNYGLRIVSAFTGNRAASTSSWYALRLEQTTVTNTSGGITNSVSLYIGGAPSGGSPTGVNAAIWVDAGTSRFDTSQTIASAAGATLNAFTIPADTITISGVTNITTATGFNLVNIGIPTYANASIAITIGATLYIAGAPTVSGGGSITTAHALWVDSGSTRLDGSLAITTDAGLTITSAIATPLASWVMDIQNGSGSKELSVLTGTVANSSVAWTAPFTIYKRARGNIATPTALNSGDHIAQISFSGHDGAAYNAVASIEVLSAEAFGVANWGSEIRLRTTPIGSVTIATTLSLTSALATFKDAINIVLGSTTGTKIGTATTQKLAFYNATPIVQGLAVADVADGLLATTITQLNSLLARIRATGLIAT